MADQSLLKLLGSEAQQKLALLMLESLGPAALDRTVPEGAQSPYESDRSALSWAGPVLVHLRRHHQRGHQRDPSQHHRRARLGQPGARAMTTTARNWCGYWPSEGRFVANFGPERHRIG